MDESQPNSFIEPQPLPKRKLALVIHALHGGGAERLMSQLANRWSQAGHEVHLITLAHTSTDKYRVDANVHRHGLNLMQPSRHPLAGLAANFKRVRCLRQQLKQLDPDLVLSFCDRMNIVALSAALPLKKPIWIAEHSNPQFQVLGLFWETWRQLSYRALARTRQGGCVVLSGTIAEYMQKRFKGLPLRVITPAINLYQCVNTKVQLPFSGLPKQLLFLGRLSQEKNLPELLKAWQLISGKFPNWKLVVAGDGAEHAELLGLAEQWQLERIEFPGWIDDPTPRLAESDLFVLPSHYEGFPVAMLEAMAAHVACVVTPCTTALPLDGYELCPGFDAESIASTLTKLMANDTARRLLAQRGAQAAREYSWEKVGKLWDEVLSANDLGGTG